MNVFSVFFGNINNQTKLNVNFFAFCMNGLDFTGDDHLILSSVFYNV